MATFSAYLRSRSDDELVALLLRRPDLATPSPSTLSSLAARATSRSSLERALAGVDAVVLQVVEAVAALHGPADPVTAHDVRRALGATDPADAALVRDALDRARALLLVRPDVTDDTDPDAHGSAGEHPVEAASAGPAADDVPLVPAPGLADLFGPYPAGLARASDAAGGADGPAPGREPVEELLARAPAGARSVLDALMWGPPVGVLPAPRTPAREAVQWLLGQGLLVPGDARHVLLPRAVALALRGGRTHRTLARPPAVPPGAGAADAADDPATPAAAAPPGTGAAARTAVSGRASRGAPLSPEVVAAESGRAAEQVVRLVAGLVRAWEIEPAPVLRAGGLGVRELRRVAARLEVDDTEAALVVELAGAAGLVVDDEEETPSFAPAAAVDEWLAAELPIRWSTLARTWLATARAAWLVGTRDDRGIVRAALDPELVRPWAPRLRRSVLGVLADVPPGVALDAAQVLDQLTWRTPRSVPPEHAVAATLREATLLGVVAAGALAPAGRALLTAVTGSDGAPGLVLERRAGPVADTVADALVGALASTVDEMLLQADLTGVVPGRPSPALEALVERAARVESRGGALTVRFTPESVRGALDAGTTADELLADLAAHSRGPVPQPLEYLVRDAARRHGRLRAGAISSYVRAEDPALLAGLVEDPRLAPLGLVRLAPTVLGSQGSTRELLAALRERGLAPVAEGSNGQIVHAERVVRRVHGRSRRIAPVSPAHADDGAPASAARRERLAALVPDLRRAEEVQQAAREADRAAQARALELREAQQRLVEAERARAAAELAAAPRADGPGAGPAAGSANGTTSVTANGTSSGTADGASSGTDGTADGRRTDGTASPGGATDAGADPGTASTGTPSTARPATGPAPEGTADPATALGILREAVADRTQVWLELVDHHGVPQRRLVRPLRVDAGRLRAVDPARDAELTVAVHRIASVTRVPSAPEPPAASDEAQHDPPAPPGTPTEETHD
ncbi:helicase C-terminal domain-containing protein [Cellulomonas sp. NS3]|uniref:helicase C-terminal domain-containing protein n=1 Tax=Cellulomonas sp. NS3 TaxID=2973977 RepID=UPI0021610D8D|nr:helicase C-terminal domain-containing protein [Cellulomonas sp. NS3]